MASVHPAPPAVGLALLLLAAAPLDARTVELGFPDVKERVQVSFPANHLPGKSYPAVFYYHGTNGKPTTELIRAHTGPDDWFVVGMAYAQTGKFTFTPETLEAEALILRSVIRHLGAGHGLDPKRVYVAGFSKGGWISGLLMQRERTLAGAVILGAGHIHRVDQSPAKFKRPPAVFIGIGRRDGNYPFSLRAVSFYRGLGAATTMETWHGLGHRFPPDGSPALRQWLQARIRPAADLRTAAAAWAADRPRELAAIADPVDRWVALLDAEQAPFFRYLDAAQKAAFTSKREALERTAAVKPEAAFLARHRKLLRSEIATHSKENYESLLKAYLDLSTAAAGTRQGEIARHDHQRIERLLKHFDAQEELRKDDLQPFGPEPEDDPFVPKSPVSPPRIPANPLVR
ncbi:MAG: hypothetical protein HKO57_04715 [Akkermansiaceae bacterium]|nr:hypothetical protein [Akkermansiaceae bacterium]